MKRAVIAAAVTCLPLAAFAHHSQRHYDRSSVLELVGEVLEVAWRNPHVFVTLRSDDPVAGETVWTLEGTAVTALGRRGISSQPVFVGQHVRIAGHLSTTREGQMTLENVLLPDGTEVVFGRTARWPIDASSVMGGTSGSNAPTSTDLLDRGLFQVWGRLAGTLYTVDGDFPLTDSAEAVRETWRSSIDESGSSCIAPGMPRIISQTIFPIELVEFSDRIELRLEEFSQVRAIYLDPRIKAEEQPRSPLGFSAGEWEEETLVVRTTRLNYPWFDRDGIPLSESASIIERFTLRADGTELDREFTVSDPEVFTQPISGIQRYRSRPDLELLPYDCVVE